MELAKDIIYAIFGLFILVTGILEAAGVEVIVFGAVLLSIAVAFIVYEVIQRSKKNKLN